MRSQIPLLFSSLILALGVTFHASAADRPNILLILADDLGYSDLGCYGGEIQTPNIDRLASGGVRFTQFYTSARCCPTRASLMTGVYPSQAGIGDFTTNQPSKTQGPGYLGRLNENCVTLAEALKPAGYGCYYVGKWHLHPQTGPIQRGFDEFYGYTNGYAQDQYTPSKYQRLPEGRPKEVKVANDEFYATDVFNQYALEFIRQGQTSKQPWFLFLGHSSPHFPVQAPADRVDQYFDLYMQGWDELREKRFARMKELGLIDGDHWKLSPRSIVPVEPGDIANGYSGEINPAWADLDTDRQRDLARRMAVFAAMVDSIDQGVGKIVEHLEATGDLENTLILFLSDNGACYEWGPFGFDGQSRAGETILRTGDQLREIGQPGTHQSYGSAWANLGNSPFRMYKHFTHEGGISSPLIVHWPAGLGKPNQWARDPAHVMDILPSLVEVAGGTYPDFVHDRPITPCEGSSLLPVWQGKQLAQRVIGFDHMGARALRQGDWKIVRSKRMPYEIDWELYNLAEDRCELNDLADQFPERVQEMAAKWETWARHVQVIWEDTSSETTQREPSSPTIANRAFTASGTVRLSGDRGVVAVQGGREYGYAIHVLKGKLAFDVRTSTDKVTRIVSRDNVPESFAFEAKLDRQKMVLSVDGKVVAQTDSPGLIPVQPKDGLSLEKDILTSAGSYEAPNPLAGQVLSFQVTAKPEK
ncbi:arylsulfatase [Bremerella sp.]|uniref:arylsulfatase n=1 Tax=Bremerella sp. TaxID=2795602 RepID=UPI00391CABAC